MTALPARLSRAFGVPAGAPCTTVSARVVRAGDLAIKVFAPDERARGVLECAMLACVAGQGGGRYRVQTPVRAADGQALFEDAEGAALATRWEQGAARDYTAIAPGEWALLGRSLAALHARLDAAPGAGAVPAARLAEILRTRNIDREARSLEAERDEVRSRGAGAPGYETAVQLLAHRASLLAERGTAALPAGCAQGLIHNDYNQHNYLFTPGELPLVLDWDRAQIAPREYELVRCLNHLPLVAPGCAARFVRAYREVRALDHDVLTAAVGVAMTEHALKRWPIDAWLAGAPGALARLRALAPVVRALAEGHRRLDAFYAGTQ